jgi:hypothetical protein
MAVSAQAEIPSQFGRSAVVTGATGGLGYEMALALAIDPSVEVIERDLRLVRVMVTCVRDGVLRDVLQCQPLAKATASHQSDLRTTPVGKTACWLVRAVGAKAAPPARAGSPEVRTLH